MALRLPYPISKTFAAEGVTEVDEEMGSLDAPPGSRSFAVRRGTISAGRKEQRQYAPVSQ